MTTTAPAVTSADAAFAAMYAATEAIETARLALDADGGRLPSEAEYDEVRHIVQETHDLLERFIPSESAIESLESPPTAADIGLLWSFANVIGLYALEYDGIAKQLNELVSHADDARLVACP